MTSIIHEMFVKNEDFTPSNEVELAYQRFRNFSIRKNVISIMLFWWILKEIWKLRIIPPFHSFLYYEIIKEIKKNGLAYSRDILEVGCGLGIGIYKIAKQFPDFKILATDIDRECINFNKVNFKIPNIEWYDCQWKDIKGSYDIVLVIDVIEHLKEYEAFLLKLTYMLNKEGTVFLSTPNKPLYQSKVTSEYHYREWDCQAFAHLLRKYFSQVEVSLKKGWIFAVVKKPQVN